VKSETQKKLTIQRQMLHILSVDQVEHLEEYWVVDRKVLLQLFDGMTEKRNLQLAICCVCV
jgi:hypothetical protein